MDQLLAKLTNLNYELFGIFLPGFIAGLFLLLFWVSLGPLATFVTMDTLAPLSFLKLLNVVGSLTLVTGVGVAIPALIASYFLGHILMWFSRTGAQEPRLPKPILVWKALTFRIPKPPSSYDPKLQPLYDFVQAEFAPPGQLLEWRHFYPVVKNHLAQNLAYSLVSTYQNKYTFHRSLTTAAAGLVWLSVLGVLVGVVTGWAAGTPIRWLPQTSLALFGTLLVYGFSGSYLYNWEMFGNSIITESYALIRRPPQ